MHWNDWLAHAVGALFAAADVAGHEAGKVVGQPVVFARGTATTQPVPGRHQATVLHRDMGSPPYSQ